LFLLRRSGQEEGNAALWEERVAGKKKKQKKMSGDGRIGKEHIFLNRQKGKARPDPLQERREEEGRQRESGGPFGPGKREEEDQCSNRKTLPPP